MIEALAQAAAILAYRTLGSRQRDHRPVRRHRQRALPPAGRARRPAAARSRRDPAWSAASASSPRARMVGDEVAAEAELLAASRPRRRRLSARWRASTRPRWSIPARELADDVEVGPYSVDRPGRDDRRRARSSARTSSSPAARRSARATGSSSSRRSATSRRTASTAASRRPRRSATTTSFREFVTIHAGTAQDRGDTAIGNGNLFLAYTHVAHDCVDRQLHDVLQQRADRRPRDDRRLGR